MGVDFYPCVVCREIGNDCMDYYYCASCSGHLFECCYDEQKEKYGTVENKELIDDFGEDALKECDTCSKTTLKARIKEKKKELEELEKQL